MRHWLALTVVLVLMFQACAAASSGSMLFTGGTDAWALDWSAELGPIGVGTWQQGGNYVKVSVYEAEVVARVSVFRIGAGHRWWDAGDTGTEWYVRGGVVLPVGPIRVRTDATYSAEGLAHEADASLVLPIVDADMLITVAYRDWQRDGWYSGMLFGVGTEF